MMAMERIAILIKENILVLQGNILELSWADVFRVVNQAKVQLH